jgi:hypothetical protein
MRKPSGAGYAARASGISNGGEKGDELTHEHNISSPLRVYLSGMDVSPALPLDSGVVARA